MRRDELLETKRKLKRKGINDVRMSIELPTADEPYLNSPVRVSKHTGEILLSLSFRVRPDKMKPIDQAIEILQELKRSE